MPQTSRRTLSRTLRLLPVSNNFSSIVFWLMLLLFVAGSFAHLIDITLSNGSNNNHNSNSNGDNDDNSNYININNRSRFVYNKSKTDIQQYAIASTGIVEGTTTPTTLTTDQHTNLNLHEENKADPIPMEFYRQLNNISDISEFLEKFIDNESLEHKSAIQENLHNPVERAAVVKATSAICMPENTVVPLTPLNPKNFYFPRCTRVKRCGGCCSTQWMSCQPTRIELINFQVHRYCYNDGRPTICGKDIVPIEQHTACKCDCRLKPEDCNAFQRYEDCRCLCNNDEARSKCLQLDHKTWDDVSCRCVCKQSENCTTGTFYDENQCKCLVFKSNNINNNNNNNIINNANSFSYVLVDTTLLRGTNQAKSRLHNSV